MSTAIQTHSISKLRHMAMRGRAIAARAREKTEEALSHGIQIGETAGTAFGWGYAHTKWGTNGELQFQGVPADLIVGLGLTGLAILGGAGKQAEHAYNVAAGSLSAYAFRAGAHMAATNP
jgi:hypothetical protein